MLKNRFEVLSNMHSSHKPAGQVANSSVCLPRKNDLLFAV